MTRQLTVLALICTISMIAPTTRAAGRPAECAPLPPGKEALPLRDLSGPLPVPDYFDLLLGCQDQFSRVSAPDSPWQTKDASRYSALLAKGKYALLVVPAQNQFYGFDAIERALISAEVADAFAGEGAMPAPSLVARALGEFRRSYTGYMVDELTANLGVTRRVDVFAGHDGNQKLTLTIQLRECAAGKNCHVLRQHDWRALPFSDQNPPFRVVNGLRAEIRRELLGVSRPQKPVPVGSSMTSLFGVTPAQVMSSKQAASPAMTALLASLAPMRPEQARNRLNVITLRDWVDAPAGSDGRMLAALAALNLQRPAYAEFLFEGVDTAAGRTLRGLVKQDFKAVQQEIVNVKPSLGRLLLEIQLQEIAQRLGRRVNFDAALATTVFGSAADAWMPLLTRRIEEGDGWQSSSALVIKSALDVLSPSASYKLDAVVVGTAVISGQAPDDASINVANFRHVDFALGTLVASACCSQMPGSGRWQMYWLLEGMTQADALQQISKYSTVLASPGAANDLAEKYDSVLAGHPNFERQRSYLWWKLGQGVNSTTSPRLREQSEKARLVAAYWTQGQSIDSNELVFGRSDMVIFAEAYSRDFPHRAYWSRPLPSVAQTTQVPDTPSVPAKVLVTDDDEQLAQLRADAREDPDAWGSVYSLGEATLKRLGDAHEAQRIFLAYPGFKPNSQENPVGLSNAAYDSGTQLFWNGYVDLARPLYKIAADLDTGSGASLVSAGRLEQLDGNYEEAAQWYLQAAARYSNEYQFRDGLSLLYATGHDREADAAFGQIAEAFELPQVWQAAVVGKRKVGMTYEQMKKWVLSDEIRNAHYRGRRFAPYFALIWATTDRKVPADFGDFMVQVERDADRTMDGRNVTMPSTDEEGMRQLLYPSKFRFGKVPMPPTGTRVKSEYVLFADALTALHAGRYEAAVTKFNAFSDLYSFDAVMGMPWVMPYFARAAAMTGDKDHLEAYIDARSEKEQVFDVMLAQATFAAVRHDVAGAEQLLTRALRFRPWQDHYRPLVPEYEFVEICEFAATETGDARFNRMLLDWAKAYQRMQPAVAWGYAVEAQYSTNRIEADRALALALYLDPQSSRLAKFDAKQRATAQAWLKANNPFLQHRAGKPRKGL